MGPYYDTATMQHVERTARPKHDVETLHYREPPAEATVPRRLAALALIATTLLLPALGL